MCQRRRVVFIEFSRTSPALHYKGVNVHKVGVLLVMPALSVVNDLKDYGVNVCLLHADRLLVFGRSSDSLVGRVTVGRETPE